MDQKSHWWRTSETARGDYTLPLSFWCSLYSASSFASFLLFPIGSKYSTTIIVFHLLGVFSIYKKIRLVTMWWHYPNISLWRTSYNYLSCNDSITKTSPYYIVGDKRLCTGVWKKGKREFSAPRFSGGETRGDSQKSKQQIVAIRDNFLFYIPFYSLRG